MTANKMVKVIWRKEKKNKKKKWNQLKAWTRLNKLSSADLTNKSKRLRFKTKKRKQLKIKV